MNYSFDNKVYQKKVERARRKAQGRLMDTPLERSKQFDRRNMNVKREVWAGDVGKRGGSIQTPCLGKKKRE